METQGNLHNPEFTILEFYRVGATYLDIMKDIEELVVFIYTELKQSVIPAQAGIQSKDWIPDQVGDDKTIIYQGKRLNSPRHGNGYRSPRHLKSTLTSILRNFWMKRKREKLPETKVQRRNGHNVGAAL